MTVNTSALQITDYGLNHLIGAECNLPTKYTECLPAVYTGKEDSLSFICRSHLPGVVNHSLFIAMRAPSVNLQEEKALIDTVYSWDHHTQQSVNSSQSVLTTGPFSSVSSSSSRATDDCSTRLKITVDWISWPENSGQKHKYVRNNPWQSVSCSKLMYNTLQDIMCGCIWTFFPDQCGWGVWII